MIGKREQNRLKKQAQILGAARTLVQDRGTTEFSMQELARTADVALVTPYNYFESKAGILVALLNQFKSNLMDADSREKFQGHNALDRLLLISAHGVKEYTCNEAFYRPLLAGLIKLEAELTTTTAEWTPLWISAVKDATESGHIHDFVDVGLVARSLHILWTGAQWKWILGETTNEEFLCDVQYGTVTLLLGVASDKGIPLLRHRFSEAERDALKAASRRASRSTSTDRPPRA